MGFTGLHLTNQLNQNFNFYFLKVILSKNKKINQQRK